MPDQIVTKFRCNLRLEALNLVGSQLHRHARVEVNQMIAMLHVGRFEAGRGALEGMPMHHALLLQNREGSMDRRKRDRRVDRMGTPVQLGRTRVIV
jgi:hypothetical protein